MAERILGIDPGSRVMGYGLIAKEGNELKYVDAGTLDLSASDALGERLVAIDAFLSQYIDVMKPDSASIESVFHAQNSRSAIVLGHARGVAMVACYRKNLKVAEYAPTDIKQSVAGYGRAEKSQIQAMVRVILGVKNTWKLDASDALAVAICHANRPRISALGTQMLKGFR